MKRLTRRDLAISAVPLLGGLVHLGCGRREAGGVDASVLEYNIDHLRSVDPELIGYDESAAIAVAAEALHGLAVGREDRLFVVADSSLVVYSGGLESERLELGAAARCVAEGEEGELFIGFEQHVEVWNLAGSRLATWESLGSRALITAIALLDEEVVVADAGQRVVHRLDREGNPLGRLGEKDPEGGAQPFVVPSPYFDLAVGADGFLWVVNPGRHTLENYAGDGSLRSSWGQSGMDIEGFCGCCNPTHLAILPNGSFVTAEKGLARVKVYAPTGQLQSVVAAPASFTEGVVGLDLAVDSRGRILVLDPTRKQVRVFVERQA